MHNKHGVTLAEMCIVLALIMIVSTMVASFCIMTSNYTAVASADRDAVEGVALVEDALSKWLSAFDRSDYTITVAADGKTLTAAKNAETGETAVQTEQTTYTLKIADGKISGDMPGERSINYSVPAIELDNFDINSNNIVCCNIKYTRKKIAEQTQVPLTLMRYQRTANVSKQQGGTVDENP